MDLSTTLRVAFIPGVAEELRSKANSADTMAWDVIFPGIVRGRNIVYTGVALAALTALAATLGAGASVVIAGSVISGLTLLVGGKELYRSIMYMYQTQGKISL